MRAHVRWHTLVQAVLLAWTLCTWAGHAKAQAQFRIPSAKTTAPPSVPTEAFAHWPNLTNISLSPDGQRIAGLLSMGDNTLLFTRRLTGEGAKLVPVLKTDNQMFRFSWFRWASNERLVVSVSFASSRGFVGTLETRLMSIRHDGQNLINLFRTSPFDGQQRQGQVQDDVVDWLPEDGHHVLMQLAVDGGIAPAVFKVNLDNASREMVQGPRRHVYEWITDAAHRVRVGVLRDEGKREVLVSDPDGQNWRTLWRYEAFSNRAVHPLGFGSDPQKLYVLADHQGKQAVFKVDLASADLKRELMLSHPQLDVGGGLIRSKVTGDVVGIRSGVRTEQRPEFWEPSLQRLARAIDKALPERDNTLLGFSQDEQLYVVYSEGNGIPGEYFVGNRQTGELTMVGETYPDLPADRLVGKQAVSIKARDGLSLRAYLTRPANATGATPLVLLPHGGPHSNDDLDFDVWTEFLASRGYAVLQVNFRGSAGFGHDFMTAGLQRWGLEMQDDLTDSVQWAVTQGVADPKRVCAVGFSYGGYAALMGAVKTPELYRCIVSVAGVSDLIDLWYHQNQYVEGGALLDRQIGNAWNDRDRLKATSPALHADQIRAPVLLIHGTQDRIVPIDQSESMDKALRRAGKRHQFIELEGGDHQLSRNSHRLTVFKALEDFLGEQLAAPKVVAQQP